jgi:hypothetical protein
MRQPRLLCSVGAVAFVAMAFYGRGLIKFPRSQKPQLVNLPNALLGEEKKEHMSKLGAMAAHQATRTMPGPAASQPMVTLFLPALHSCWAHNILENIPFIYEAVYRLKGRPFALRFRRENFDLWVQNREMVDDASQTYRGAYGKVLDLLGPEEITFEHLDMVDDANQTYRGAYGKVGFLRAWWSGPNLVVGPQFGGRPPI